MPRFPTIAALALLLAAVLAAAGCGGGSGGGGTTGAAGSGGASGATSYRGFGPSDPPGATWRPYSDSSIFNTPVAEDATPQDGSAAAVATVLRWGTPSDITAGLAGTSGDFDHPVFFARADDPLVRVHALRPYGRNPIDGRSIRIPRQARPAAGGDAHMAVVEPDGTEYDFWDVRDGGVQDGVLDFGWGGRASIEGSGIDGAATAAGYGLLAGAIRPEELAAGRIDHALFLVQKCVGDGRGTLLPREPGRTLCTGADAGAPPLGAHYVLRMSDAAIAALGAPAWKAAILTALAHYGGYVGDTGAAGLGFMTQSSESSTAYGLPDPFVAFARSAGIPRQSNGTYRFDVASGVDWTRLALVAPSSQPHG